MNITINGKSILDCSREELRAVNKSIVHRLNIIVSREEEDAVSRFSIGRRVTFTTEKKGLGKVVGTVIKINRKTVKVRLDNNQIWNVSPSMLDDYRS